jgi:hypothetical protein
MRKVVMFTRLLSGLAVAALLLTPQLALAKGWKDLEGRYEEVRADVEDAVAGKKLETKKDETQKARVKRAHSELAALPKELFEENSKKAIDLLLGDLLHETLPVALAAQKGLALAKGRQAKPLFKAFDREKDARRKRVLADVLSQIDDRGAMQSLSKATKAKNSRTRAAVARAIGKAGAARAKGSGETALRKLLRDKSLLVRHAAASALRKLGQKADKYPEPDHDGTTGLPDRYAADKVVFLVDGSKQAGEVAFNDPFAPEDGEEGKKDEGKKDEGKKKAEEEAPTLSPFQIVGGLVSEAVGGMQESEYQVIRFGSQPSPYKKGFQAGGAKEKSGLEAWFGRKLSVERDRRVLRALQEALDQDADVIYLFLCGLPTVRGGRDDSDATLEAAGQLLRGAGVQLHVIRFVLPPEQDPRTEGAKQARQEFLTRYTKVAGALASLSGGQGRTIELTRREPEGPAEDDSKKEKLDVDLTKAIGSRDKKKVQKAFQAALDEPNTEAEALVEAIAACPDPRNALPLALEALLGDEPTLSAAAARGLAKNADPRVLFAIAKTFRSEKDPANQIRLLHAMGRAPGQGVTDGLVAAVATLPRDPARVAWRYLSERPAAELAAAKAKITRRARDVEGLSKAYANVALARAANQPPPPRDGLSPAAGEFLPKRFLEGGVAFVIDSHKATKEIFYTPPEKKAAEDEEPEKGKKKPKKRKRKKKGKGEPKQDEEQQPVTVQEAIRIEVTRALEAIGRASGKANLYVTGGNSFRSGAVDMSSSLEEAKIFLTEKIRPGPQRDVLKPIERALGDFKVERIVVLVSGLPVRSLGDDDPVPFLNKVRKANAGRAVRIDVVYVLPPVDQKNAAAVARRKDELAAMDRLYGQLTGQNDGKVLIRTRLAGVGPAAAPAEEDGK